LIGAYNANQPVLLIGTHGIGKSQSLEDTATEAKIGCEIFDLSIMDSVDLAGLPVIKDGRMLYAPPVRLPTAGKGLIVFEELNRVPKDLQAPVLQICTARRFNDYCLPPGWLPCAAINPPGGDYDTLDLDPALMSRFLKIYLEADPVEWCIWAEAHNIHPVCVTYIKENPAAIQSPDLSPRTLHYISNFIKASGLEGQALLNGIVGLSDAQHGSRIFKLLGTIRVESLSVSEILKSPAEAAIKMQKMVAADRTDLVDRIVREFLLKVRSIPKGKLATLTPFINALPEHRKTEVLENLAA